MSDFKHEDAEDASSSASSTDAFLRIFSITTKQELEKHCRTLVIESGSFAGLVLGCETGAIPWIHRAIRKYKVPEHLDLDDKDIAAIGGAKAGQPLSKEAHKAFTKMDQTFKDRTVLVGHIFAAPSLSWWNLFYFSEKDTSVSDSHWIGGAHIHLINDLTRPNETANSIWSKFVSGDKLGSAIHIRFKNPRYDA